MTSPYLLADLRRDEALRLEAYPDPLSHGEPWTIGYGHTGREVHDGLLWTLKEAENALAADVAGVSRSLDRSLPWWRSLSDLRQDCLVNMAFNLGLTHLLGFKDFLALVKAGRFGEAADDAMHTQWAAQVGTRAARLSQQLRMDIHQT